MKTQKQIFGGPGDPCGRWTSTTCINTFKAVLPDQNAFWQTNTPFSDKITAKLLLFGSFYLKYWILTVSSTPVYNAYGGFKCAKCNILDVMKNLKVFHVSRKILFTTKTPFEVDLQTALAANQKLVF